MRCTKSPVSCRPVFRLLPGVELVLESDLHCETSESGSSERSVVRVDSGDSGDEEVGVLEVEGGVQRESHDWE